MSNIIPTNISIPDHLKSRLGSASNLSSAIGAGIASGESTPRISLKGGRFRIVDGGNETVINSLTLDVIIVGANPNLSKIWYEKQWTPDNEPTSPDCYSLNGLTPNPDSTKPQHSHCVSCPQNQWGSKVTQQGAKIKACADQKRLAVVDAENPDGTIYLLQVTPAALKGLNQYHKTLASRGIPAEIVRTRIGFDTNASFPKLTFDFAGFNDTTSQDAVDKLFGSPTVLEITGEASGHAIGEVVVAKPVLVKETKPVIVEPEIEIEAPPAKATGFGAKKEAAKPTVRAAVEDAIVEEPTPPAKAAGFGAKKEPEKAATSNSAALADDIRNLLESMDDE